MTVLGTFWLSSKKLKYFPLRGLYKDWNKWASKDPMSGDYGRWIRTSQPSFNNSCLVIEETCSLALPDGILCTFCWRILDTFHQVLLSVGLIGSSTYSFGFLEGAHNRGLPPIPPSTKHHLHWMKTGLWCGWWWFILLPHNLFHSTLLYSIHFSLPISLFYKWKLSFHLSRASHMEMQSRFFKKFNLFGTKTSKWLM